jgi:hypothetical protein
LTIDKAIEILDEARKLPVSQQYQMKSDILEAFETFWTAGQSRNQFAEHTRGLLMFPEILYDMITKKIAVS